MTITSAYCTPTQHTRLGALVHIRAMAHKHLDALRVPILGCHEHWGRPGLRQPRTHDAIQHCISRACTYRRGQIHAACVSRQRIHALRVAVLSCHGQRRRPVLQFHAAL